MVNGLGLNKSDAHAGDGSVVVAVAAITDVTHWERTRLLSTFHDGVVALIGSSWSSREFRRKVATLDSCTDISDVEKGWVNANVSNKWQLPQRAANKTEVFIILFGVVLFVLMHCEMMRLLHCFFRFLLSDNIH